MTLQFDDPNIHVHIAHTFGLVWFLSTLVVCKLFAIVKLMVKVTFNYKGLTLPTLFLSIFANFHFCFYREDDIHSAYVKNMQFNNLSNSLVSYVFVLRPDSVELAHGIMHASKLCVHFFVRINK